MSHSISTAIPEPSAPAPAMPSGRSQVNGLRKNRSGRTSALSTFLGIEHPLVLAPMAGPGTVERLPLSRSLSGG